MPRARTQRCRRRRHRKPPPRLQQKKVPLPRARGHSPSRIPTRRIPRDPGFFAEVLAMAKEDAERAAASADVVDRVEKFVLDDDFDYDNCPLSAPEYPYDQRPRPTPPPFAKAGSKRRGSMLLSDTKEKELQRSEPPPRTPRLYSTHLRRPSSSLLQRRREGLLQAVAVGTLQACQDGSYWSPSYQAPAKRQIELRAPLSTAWTRAHAAQEQPLPARQSPELIVSHDEDLFQLCSRFPGKRCGLVHFATGPPCFRDVRESQLFFRTTYLYAAEEMPRQMHREVEDVLGQGAIIYTAGC
ncbi:unnamed protein product [Symbiodinium natans]|uniref:Uncharacterized protein n=1 Tax=Symbiodinium natans TaxID=878477 RepID=A0A812ULT9_9DINO|nr:unnamed protein product [Symbiodinium natans]